MRRRLRTLFLLASVVITYPSPSGPYPAYPAPPGVTLPAYPAPSGIPAYPAPPGTAGYPPQV